MAAAGTLPRQPDVLTQAPVAIAAAAVLEAQAREGDGGEGEERGPRIGYLVGLRDAVFSTPHLPAGTPFHVRVASEGAAPPLSVYTARIEAGEELVAEGTISTYLP